MLSNPTAKDEDVKIRIEQLIDKGQPVSITGIEQFNPECYLGLRRKKNDEEEEPFALYDTMDEPVSFSKSTIPLSSFSLIRDILLYLILS